MQCLQSPHRQVWQFCLPSAINCRYNVNGMLFVIVTLCQVDNDMTFVLKVCDWKIGLVICLLIFGEISSNNNYKLGVV